MAKNNTGKLVASRQYGASVQLYYHSKGDDITYYACYLDPKQLDKNGKPIRKRVKIGTKTEGITQTYVNTKSIELTLQARLGEVPRNIANKFRKIQITLQELAEQYWDYRAQKTNTPVESKNIKNDQSVFRNHLSIFTNRIVEEIQDEEIEALKTNIRSKKSDSTTNNALTLLTSIMNYGIDQKLIFNKPKVNKIRGIDNQRERYFAEEEIKLIFEHLKSYPILDLFVRISLSTGGRLETIRLIKVKDINLNSNTIFLTDLKRKSSGKEHSRYVGFINTNLKNQIAEFIKGKNPDTYLFTDHTGVIVSIDYIQNNLKRLFDKLFNHNLEKNDHKYRAVVHTLRHTFASQLAIKGVPMYKIQRLMNHSDAKMTQRYAKLSPSYGLEAIEKLDFL